LVAINGLGGLARLWDGFAAALQGDFQLRVLDLPGHGEVPPAADYRYPALVEDVLHRTSDLDPFPLIGWSVGGAVAWLFAARYPDRVKTLILIEPAAPHQSRFRHAPPPEPVHPFTYSSALKAVEAMRSIDPAITVEDVEAIYRVNAAGRWEPRFDPAFFPVLVEEAREHGEEYFFELDKIRVPTLLIFGERSFIRSSEREEIASGLRSVRTETINSAGHFLVHEQPGPATALVTAFLKEQTTSP